MVWANSAPPFQVAMWSPLVFPKDVLGIPTVTHRSLLRKVEKTEAPWKDEIPVWGSIWTRSALELRRCSWEGKRAVVLCRSGRAAPIAAAAAPASKHRPVSARNRTYFPREVLRFTLQMQPRGQPRRKVLCSHVSPLLYMKSTQLPEPEQHLGGRPPTPSERGAHLGWASTAKTWH